MVIGLDFAPLLLGTPDYPLVALFFATAAGVIQVARDRPIVPCVYPMLCTGITMVVTQRTLTIPGDVLALSVIPGALVRTKGTFFDIIMQLIAATTVVIPSPTQPRVADLFFILLACRYMILSRSWGDLGLRFVALSSRLVMNWGNNLLVCACLVSSTMLEGGNAIEKALLFMISWVVSYVLYGWLPAFAALVAVVDLAL
jgi:hypothetical protein